MCALAELYGNHRQARFLVAGGTRASKLNFKRCTRGLDPQGLGKAMCAGSCDGQPASPAREGERSPIAVTARPHSERGRHSRPSAIVSSPFNFGASSRKTKLAGRPSGRRSFLFSRASAPGALSLRPARGRSNSSKNSRSAMTRLRGGIGPSLEAISPVRFLLRRLFSADRMRWSASVRKRCSTRPMWQAKFDECASIFSPVWRVSITGVCKCPKSF